jgi:hypothetical protein
MSDVGSMDEYVNKAPGYLTLRKTALDIHLIRYGVDHRTGLHAADTKKTSVWPEQGHTESFVLVVNCRNAWRALTYCRKDKEIMKMC